MDIPTVPGAWYTVATASTCEITDTATGTPLGTANAGSYSFQAQGNLTTLSDDSALYSKSNFKHAPAAVMALGLLGGGSSAPSLPAGYLAAEFWEKSVVKAESTYFPYQWQDGMGVKVTAIPYNSGPTQTLIGTEYNSNGFLRIPYGNYSAVYFGTTYGGFYWKGIKNVIEVNYKNNELMRDTTESELYETALTHANPLNNGWVESGFQILAKFYNIQISIGNQVVSNYIPCLSLEGGIKLYDTLKEKFLTYKCDVIGMTLAQARNLSKLAPSGGTLTVSLPTGYDADSGVMSALETARANGWTLTIQTYEAEASAAATFGMRRVWVRKTQDENGGYIDADGTRWQVEWCVEMYTPDGSTPDEHGYEMFRSVEAAADFWQLTPYVAPDTESLTDNP